MLVRTAKRGAALRVMPRDRQRRPDGRPVIDLRPGERPSERRPLMTAAHLPVMVEEVLHFLGVKPGGVYVDGTVGAGGHAEAILASVGGRATLLGIDRDPHALNLAAHNLADYGASVRLVAAGYDEIDWILSGQDFEKVDGILLDLGMSSMQIDDAARGFSYHSDGPLDMRMDPDATLTAAEVVNGYSVEALTKILRVYGEERFAGRIARAIVDHRRTGPIRTTTALAQVVVSAYPAAARGGPHPARRTFQAIRIEVNGELKRLEALLQAAPDVLNPGGRIVVLSYHSLEDKLVKSVIASQSAKPAPLPGLPPSEEGATMRSLTRGAVVPSEAEALRNSRSTAAKLRAAVRLPEAP